MGLTGRGRKTGKKPRTTQRANVRSEACNLEKMNPNSSVYVPGRGMVKTSVLEAEKAAAAGGSPKSAPAPSPSPASSTPAAPPAKPKAAATEAPEDDDIEMTPELLKELERMKLEEGDDAEAPSGAASDVVQDDDRDHINVIFVGHVGTQPFDKQMPENLLSAVKFCSRLDMLISDLSKSMSARPRRRIARAGISLTSWIRTRKSEPRYPSFNQ